MVVGSRLRPELPIMCDFMVLIVGTEHPIQVGAWGAKRSSCESFEQQLIEWCKNEEVDAIAKEMSDKAWERARAESAVLFDRTIPRRVAGSLGLGYRDCDNGISSGKTSVQINL